MHKQAWFSAVLLSALLLGCGDDPAAPYTGSLGPSTGDGDSGDGDSGDGDSGDGDTGNPFPWNPPPVGDGDSGDGDVGDGDSGDGDAGDGDAGDGDTGSVGPGLIRGPAPTSDSASKVGPYKVESTTSGLRDGPDYAPDATLFYPTDATPPFAIVSVVPGFLSAQDTTKPWGPFLASHGIVVLTMEPNSRSDNPPLRAAALLDALKTLEAENTRAESPVFGKLDLTRQAVIGWSMGGGGALLAAEQKPSLKAVLALTPWNPGYSYSKVTVPSMLFAAAGDTLAGGQSKPFYDSLPVATPKFYWETTNSSLFFGGHDTFNDPAGLGGAVGRYGLSWMKVFLEGDTRYKPFLLETPPTKTDPGYAVSL